MTNISFSIELDIENLEVKEVKQNRSLWNLCWQQKDVVVMYAVNTLINLIILTGRSEYGIYQFWAERPICTLGYQDFNVRNVEENPRQLNKFDGMRSPNTIAFEKHILLELMGSTVGCITRKTRLWNSCGNYTSSYTDKSWLGFDNLNKLVWMKYP